MGVILVDGSTDEVFEIVEECVFIVFYERETLKEELIRSVSVYRGPTQLSLHQIGEGVHVEVGSLRR